MERKRHKLNPVEERSSSDVQPSVDKADSITWGYLPAKEDLIELTPAKTARQNRVERHVTLHQEPESRSPSSGARVHDVKTSPGRRRE